MSSEEFPEGASARTTDAPAGTAVLSTPYGESTVVRRPSTRSAPSAASAAPAAAGKAASSPTTEDVLDARQAEPPSTWADSTESRASTASARTPRTPATASSPAIAARGTSAAASTADTADLDIVPLPAAESATTSMSAQTPQEAPEAGQAPGVVAPTAGAQPAEPPVIVPAARSAAVSAAVSSPPQALQHPVSEEDIPQEAEEDGAPWTALAETDGAPASQARSGRSEQVDEPLYDAGPRRRRWPIWAAAASFLLLAGVGIGGYAYASHYENLAVPGTSVAGTEVAGMSREQIVQVVKERAQGATVDISGDVATTASLEELGTTVDAEATADAVMARGDGVVERFEALLGEQSVPVVTTSNEQTAADYASSLIPSDQAKAVNATVVLDQDGRTFSTTPASSGTSLDSSAMAAAAQEAAGSLSPASVEVRFSVSEPAVSDAQAQEVADTAKSWVGQEVTITVAATEDQEAVTYTADPEDKASWIIVGTSVDSPPTLSVDSEKVSQWVSAQAQDAHADPVNGKRNVNTKGTVVATPLEAEDGRSINNAEAVATDIVTNLGQGKGYTGAFETTVVKATWEERTIADGAENLIYQAAPGEKWIDVNLSNYTVTAYEGATVVHGPVTIVDGAKETPTVTGTYQVYLQYPSQTMEGDNVDGTRYRTEDVPWVTYFHSGYAFHGAPWRSDFGYSASHGCVNMPSADAQWIYNWAEIGTTVVSH